MTRQRKLQLKYVALGLCSRCGREPLANRNLGVVCRAKERKQHREAARKKRGLKAWQPGSPGFAPLPDDVSLVRGGK